MSRFTIGHKTNVGRKHKDETKKKISDFHKGKKWSLGQKRTEETKRKMAEWQKGKLSKNWKTKNPSYGSVHTWLLKYYKHIKETCKKCGSKKFLEFALKKGRKHTHNINNYVILCSSCHKKYDYTEERKYKLSISLKGRKIVWADKISKSNMGRKMSDKTKKLMSSAAKVNYKKRKRDKNGRFK